MFKGHISTHWQLLQERYMTHNARTNPWLDYFTPTYWVSTVIQQFLVYFTLNAWQIRNEKLHADKVQTAYVTERRALKSNVHGWYIIASTLGP